MNSIELNYPTHTLFLHEMMNGFVKATNIVNGQVYDDMVDAILRERIFDDSVRFVDRERILLNNFVSSLVGFNNNSDNMLSLAYRMYFFTDDLQYQIFCLTNDLQYKEQEWFKTIYVKSSFLNGISLFKQASSSLVKNLYPEHFSLPPNLLEDLIKSKIKIRENLKCDFCEISQFLKDNHIDCLYHFTNKKNIDSIKTNGLCSISLLNDMGAKVYFSSSESSRQIDKAKSLANYVHLSYESKNPMLYLALAEGRLYEYVILNVSPEVLTYKSTMFSDINAASSNARISPDISFFLSLKFHEFHNRNYNNLSSDAKKLFQAEVLVENRIQTHLIINLPNL